MKLISFDIETWGVKPGYTLQPWRVETKEAGVLSIASTCNTVTFCELFPTAESIPVMLDADKDDLLCGWNLKFDLAFLCALGLQKYLQKFKYLDGMLLLRKLGFNLRSYGLKQSLRHFKKHLDIQDDYNKDIEFKVGFPLNVYTEQEAADMLTYNSRDAEYTLQLVKHLISIAPKETVQQAIRESTVSFLFADAWLRGILIDKDKLKENSIAMDEKLKRLEKILTTVSLTPKIIASPMQLQRYLRDDLKIQLTEKTDKGRWSVDSKVLKNIYYKTTGDEQQILRLILRYKELKTEQTKFIKSAEACLQDSSLIHSDPILSSTYTGRLTYKMYQKIKKIKTFKNGTTKEVNARLQIGLPLHQIKKTGRIRSIFIAPKGYSLVELDFCAQEMRLIACIAEESTMISLFNINKDMHAYTAASIAGMGYDDFVALKQTEATEYESMRKIGKLTNLALQYRMGTRRMYREWHDVYGLVDKTQEDAQLARATYLRIYPSIPQYWKANPMIARHLGYVESKGHKRCCITNWDAENRYKSEQTAINFPIQATGADQKILALYCLRDYLHENEIRFAWDLHDGMFFYVPECMMQHEVILGMVDILNDLPYKAAWGWTPQVKFPVEAKVGKKWGELEEI